MFVGTLVAIAPLLAPPMDVAAIKADAAAESGREIPDAPTAELPPQPTTGADFLQYGVAFTVEGVVSAGPLCVDPCVLGSGGGLAVRIGRRWSAFYLGGAYELSKQGSNNIYRLGILQQARVEGRYYLDTGRVTQPFAQVGAGVVGYGNRWEIDTKGPMVSLGIGAQAEIAKDVVVGVGAAYRALLLDSFTDSAGNARHGGVASLIGVDFQLEAMDPWPFSNRR